VGRLAGDALNHGPRTGFGRVRVRPSRDRREDQQMNVLQSRRVSSPAVSWQVVPIRPQRDQVGSLPRRAASGIAYPTACLFLFPSVLIDSVEIRFAK
jgi:hypothetical protein